MKDRSTLYLACSTLGLLALATAPVPQANADDAPAQLATIQHQPNKGAGELLRRVRAATYKYRDVAAAEGAEYQLLFGCVSGPDYGAMGLHYVKVALLGDGKVDADEPEIVIYEPQPNGRLKLIGADFLVFKADWLADPQHTSAPELYGQKFHEFDEPNRFGLPAFYTLHVWAWKDNPTGTFSNWHQNVSCDSFTGENK
jgi:hypothetical protein